MDLLCMGGKHYILQIGDIKWKSQCKVWDTSVEVVGQWVPTGLWNRIGHCFALVTYHRYVIKTPVAEGITYSGWRIQRNWSQPSRKPPLHWLAFTVPEGMTQATREKSSHSLAECWALTLPYWPARQSVLLVEAMNVVEQLTAFWMNSRPAPWGHLGSHRSQDRTCYCFVKWPCCWIAFYIFMVISTDRLLSVWVKAASFWNEQQSVEGCVRGQGAGKKILCAQP